MYFFLYSGIIRWRNIFLNNCSISSFTFVSSFHSYRTLTLTLCSTAKSRGAWSPTMLLERMRRWRRRKSLVD